MGKQARGRRSRRNRSLAGEVAYRVTLLWLAFVVVSPYLTGGFTTDSTGFHVSYNYPLAMLLALIPAAAWVWLFRVREAEKAAGKSIEELQALSPAAFEQWVGARFSDLGFTAKVTGTQGDHGVDLIVVKDGRKAVVQCKNYRSWSVGEPVLRDLLGAMHDFKVERAYLVTTGKLTKAALEWVKGKPIEVWDGDHLARLSMEQGKRPNEQAAELDPISSPAGSRYALPATITNNGLAIMTMSAEDAEPIQTQSLSHSVTTRATPVEACPKCGKTLVVRRNRHTGESFLACPGFPECRYTTALVAEV